MNETHIYHIYAKDKCLYHSLKEDEFNNTWKMIENLFDLIGTEEMSMDNITFEKVSMDKEIILNSSH